MAVVGGRARLPLDRRLLFVAELTGQMVGCVGNAPTRPSQEHPLYRRLAIFTRLTTLDWLRDVELHHDMKAYEAPLVLNLPAINWWTAGAMLPALPGANRLIY